ncbi:MAG: hypothetical protein C5B50_18560 [Verrucomicrobia bacterium]|nr:MAG: hypothetical protein C5B50_18560 [Verrucomicrobiota bacterium]
MGGLGGNGGTGGTGELNGGNGGNGAKGGDAFGGAIYHQGTSLFVTNCTFSGNTVVGGSGGNGGTNGTGAVDGLGGTPAAGGAAWGAGIYNVYNTNGSQSVQVLSSTFSGNAARAGSGGSGIGKSQNGNGITGANGGNCFGGAICALGALLNVTNCTLFTNTASGGTGGGGGAGSANAGNGGNGGSGSGGGIYSTTGIVWVVSSTIASGAAIGGTGGAAGSTGAGGTQGSTGAAHGGGIANGSGTFNLQNSILSTNRLGLNANGTIVNVAHNLSTDTTPTGSSWTSSQKSYPLLAPLANNGGPTKTMALLYTTNPAYAQIPASDGFPTNDQRGLPRPGLGKTQADIGAYEVSPPSITGPPQYQHPINGGSVVFSIGVNGDSPLSYQWRFNGTNIPGATKSTYSVASVTNGNVGPYSVRVTNTFGTNFSLSTNVLFAPSIISPPTNQTAQAGDTVSFGAAWAGDLSGVTNWWIGTNITGATGITNGSSLNPLTINIYTNAFTLPNVQLSNAGPYSFIVGNNFGAVTSSFALTIQAPLQIISAPTNVAVAEGSDATFRVVATGSGLTYQWQANGVPTGVTQSSYTRPQVMPSDAGNYTVTVGSPNGNATRSANLTVVVRPGLTNQPSSPTSTQGQSVTFYAYAIGAYVTNSTSGVPGTTNAPLSYQWQHNGTNVAGATSSAVTLTNVGPADAGGYSVFLSNLAGSTSNLVALLTVAVPPAIATPPHSVTVVQGQNTNFSVTAIGAYTPSGPVAGTADFPLSYQWKYYGTNVPAATAAVLSITNAQRANVGPYSVQITNLLGATNSAPATLTIVSPPIIFNRTTNVLTLIVFTASNLTYTLQDNTDITSSSWNTVATQNSPTNAFWTNTFYFTNPPTRFFRIMTP